jgi:hypothetical protein
MSAPFMGAVVFALLAAGLLIVATGNTLRLRQNGYGRDAGLCATGSASASQPQWGQSFTLSVAAPGRNSSEQFTTAAKSQGSREPSNVMRNVDLKP